MTRRRSSSAQPNRILMRKRLLLAGGVLAAVALIAIGISLIQRARLAPNLIGVARQSAADRDFATSTAMYEEYVKLRPRDAEVIAELAGVYDEYARASLAKPRDAAALWERSTTAYLTALALDASRHEDRRKLAKLYIGMGHFADGKKQAELLAKEPSLKDDPEVHELLAACEQQNHEAAARHLRASLDTGKAEVNIYLRLAHLLKFQINTPAAHAEADDVMRRLVSKDHKDDLKARLARARYYADTKRRAEAKADIRYAYEQIPGGKDNTDVILAHADTLAADSLPEARGVLTAGLKAHPGQPQLLLGLAEVETRAGNRPAAAAALGELLAKLDDSDPLLLEAADRVLDLGDTAQAAALTRRVAGSPQLSAVAGYLQGRVKLIEGDWPAALALLTQAVQTLDANRTLPRKQSHLLRAHLGVAACYGLANDPERQAEACLKAVATDGSNIPARVMLVDAFLKLDRTDKALNVLQGIAPYSAAAQVTIARLKLADAFRQPAGYERRFDAFWDTVGRTGPYSPEVAHLVADAHVQQGHADQAAKVLETAIKEKPSAQLYITLAAVKGSGGAEPALAVLADADKALGPNPDLRLARAVVALRDPKADAKAVAALADGPFDPAERFKLKSAVGELLLTAGKGAEGVPLLQAAAKERPFDLNVRLVLFDWAVATGDAALRDVMLRELRGIDGDDGAIAVAAQATAELKGEKKLTPERNRELSDRLKEARAKRTAWGRLPYLLGVLAREDGRADEALDLFESAITKGERSEPLVREVVQLLVQRDRYPQAMRLLGGLKASGKLSPELDRQYRLLEAVASNDPARAVQWVRTPEAAASKNYQDHLLRGLVLAQFGETDEAQQAFILAGKLAPDAAEVYVTRVRVMVAAGIPAEKLKPVVATAAEKLAQAKPANPAAVPVALGRMYELIGETKLATEQYHKARAAAPGDGEPARLLYDLFARTGDTAAANRLLDELIAGGRPDLARWARRTRALAVADLPQPHKLLPQALKLIDDNLADGQLTDDVRAKALVQARDPFQRQKALQEMQASLTRGPLTPDQSYRIALLRFQSGDTSGAEQVLANATRSGLLANPLHLEFLLRLQLGRNDTSAAKATLDRIKVLAPNQPLAVVSEARVIAKSGKEEDQARAAKLVLALPNADPYRRVVGVGPLLESLGCLKEAEELYTEFSKGSTDPKASHLPLAEFLARRGRADDAVKLVLEKHTTTPNIPPTTTARMLVAAVRSAPDQRDAVQKAEQFITAAVEGEPKSAELLTSLAEVQDIRKQHKQAIATYKRALDADPKGLRPVILNNLAGLRALVDRDGSDEVLGLVNDAIAELGPEPYLLDTRATVRMASGNDLKAVEDLEAAFAVNPSPVYQFHLTQCHERMKATADRDRAIASAKKLGLKKAMLHPLEWPEFERLMR